MIGEVMSDKKQDKAVLSAITDTDLQAVSVFLHHHMNDKFSPDKWEKGITVNWLDEAPNHGFMLKHDGNIVGVLCAIYSEQHVGDTVEKFCNPHSWCVLPDHRKRSVDLVLAVIRQQGFHFTMFSPNVDGVQIFSYLKFKPLDNTVAILLNVPTMNFTRTRIIDDPAVAIDLLPEPQNKYYKEHMQFPWLNFLAFEKEGKLGFIIYKKQELKKLPCALILYTSDEMLLHDCWPTIRTHLLMKHGFVTSKIEERLLDRPLGFTLKKEPGGKKFFLSEELPQDKIKYVYSELMALDI